VQRQPGPGQVEHHQLRGPRDWFDAEARRVPGCRGGQVSLAELARAAPFVEFRAGTELRRRLDIAFESAGLVRVIAFELGQLTEMITFAAAGLGTAIVPQAFTTELAASVRDSVCVLRLADPSLTLNVCVHSRPEFLPPAARALADRIVTWCRQAA
jgi:DNA-binding transcriptional LysR family regulator